MKSRNIYVVDTIEEAEQFRYTDTNEVVEVGTAVGYDKPMVGMPGDSPPPEGWNRNHTPVEMLVCFDDIYFQSDD